MIWSPQQQAFLDWCANGTGSTVLEAVAGAGKTTVLIEAGRVIRGQVGYMVYNKKNADEAKVKITKAGMDWKKMQAGTAHSFGMSAYRKAQPHVQVEENKVRDLVDAAIPAARQDGAAYTEAHPLRIFAPAVTQLVSLAKQTGIGIPGLAINDAHTWLNMADHFDVFDEDESPIPAEVKLEVVRTAARVLKRSSDMLDLIDFDDMIYMPLLHRVRFWQFDVVMVDEAQDTNATRRALVRAMLKRGGRCIAVGDRHQAIYGFTGADSDALDLIAGDFNCSRMPLTVTYRCPKSVVAFARQWVGHIEAHDTAPEGLVSQQDLEDFLARNDLDRHSAVLSRTTKPLVSLAFQLLRQRTPCRIEGRDVGGSIKKLMQRWKVKNLSALEDKLSGYLARETTKLLAAKKEQKLAAVEDSVETVRVIIQQCRSEGKTKVEDAVAHVDTMFADGVDNVLTLSTIHKSKGREWSRVFWLDRAGTCPSRWARQEWQVGQEVNLMYVAATRAQAELIELLPPAKTGEAGE